MNCQRFAYYLYGLCLQDVVVNGGGYGSLNQSLCCAFHQETQTAEKIFYECGRSCHNGVTTHTSRPCYGNSICIEIFSGV